MKYCRRSSLDWQLQGGIGMSRHMPVNFSNRVSGHGLAESDGGIQTYHTPLSQTFTAVDFDMQVSTHTLTLLLTQLFVCQ